MYHVPKAGGGGGTQLPQRGPPKAPYEVGIGAEHDMRTFFWLSEAGLYADFGSDLRQVLFVCGLPVPTLKNVRKNPKNLEKMVFALFKAITSS